MMLTVDNYGRIRRPHRDGMSIRRIAPEFHHSRHKIGNILHGDQAELGDYPRRERQSAPKLGVFHDRILEILNDDETAPSKQRHTAMRIFERLPRLDVLRAAQLEVMKDPAHPSFPRSTVAKLKQPTDNSQSSERKLRRFDTPTQHQFDSRRRSNLIATRSRKDNNHD